MTDGFFEAVYAVTRRIPYGRVMSYGQIARVLGRPHGARLVGYAMRCCPDDVPWQRVVMQDGTVAGGLYAEQRRARLASEGVIFLSDGRVNMAVCQYREEALP